MNANTGRIRWLVLAVSLAVFAVAAVAVPAAEPPWSVTLNDPARAPSAAGERLILREAGLLRDGLPRSISPSLAPAGPSALQAGADVIVNNPANDTPENTTQSETSMAVRGSTICAGYNDSSVPNFFSGLSRSADRGATWTELPPIGQNGDPVLAVHRRTGRFFYAELGNPVPGVFRSTDDCRTFGARVNVGTTTPTPGTTTLGDKPWIAVDNTRGLRDGNIYVCWTRFFNVAPFSELRFSRSTDGGLTYGNEQVLATGTGPFGCSVAVGPNGEVNVTWADRDGVSNFIQFRRSINGGLTFTPAVPASGVNRQPGTDRIVTCEQPRTTLNGDIRMLHQSWLAVDTTGGPFNGNIYAVWASDPVGAVDNSDVFFSRSTNGGLTWSLPVQLGAGGGLTDQFEPFVAVGRNGTVSVSWYDRRRDPVNNRLIDVFKAFSRTGGLTFDPIIRVTDVNFNVPPINPNFDNRVVRCYMGEYIGIASDQRNFYYIWGDNRNILTTTAFPTGRPDPDVFFEREEAPCPIERDDDDNDDDGLDDADESLFGTLLNLADSDLDGIKDGNDDADGDGLDDEDEDDEDECPDDRNENGEDDEDEDDEEGDD
jgi:hypothetical protein